MTGYEKWVMIFGFDPKYYDTLMGEIIFHRQAVKECGNSKIRMQDFLSRIFRRTPFIHITHSACIDFNTIVESDSYMTADLIEGGGLYNLAKKVNSAKTLRPEKKYEYIKCNLSFMSNTSHYIFLAVIIDGDIVLDTKTQYGSLIEQDNYMNSIGQYNYVKELVEIINNNLKSQYFPEVPKGILTLPENFDKGI